MKLPIGPIYLLADSEPLFRDDVADGPFVASIRRQLGGERLTAAYIGASNRDQPEFYAIFEAAMDRAGIEERRLIKSRYSAMDDLCLRAADLIVLAGGDVALGWRVIATTGMRDVVVERHYAGAAIVGVSAGAVQLGLPATAADAPTGDDPSDTFRLVPFIVDVHDEENRWAPLRRAVRAAGAETRGIGIPKGGVLVYHPDRSLEPLRRPAFEYAMRDGEIVETLLVPKGRASGAESTTT